MEEKSSYGCQNMDLVGKFHGNVEFNVEENQREILDFVCHEEI